MPFAKATDEELTPRSKLTHIGNWRLGPTLGRGAYGHVRLATHINGRKAACKILPALHRNPNEPVTWDQTVDAMEAHKEVVLLKALSGLKLPGVVKLEGIVEKDGWTFIFSTLHSHSAAQILTPWSHQDIVGFFRRLCLAVHSLHQLNISHEDLKRSNVMVDALGCPALIDFGFSHFAAYGQVVKSAGGTLDYTSPEKAEDGMYDGRANDVWALGIFLVKILGIPHPYIDFAVDTESKAKKNIISGDGNFDFKPEHIGAGMAASLILQMLEPDVWERITIPEILHHPFLRTPYPDPHLISLPSFELPSRLFRKLPTDVVQDICFLSYLNHEFHLCETSEIIESRLYGNEPCWEKRWAKMLYRWKHRDDMDWRDLAVHTTMKQRVPGRSAHRLVDSNHPRKALNVIPPNAQLDIKGKGRKTAAAPANGKPKRPHDAMDISNTGREVDRSNKPSAPKRSRRSPGLSDISLLESPTPPQRSEARARKATGSRAPSNGYRRSEYRATQNKDLLGVEEDDESLGRDLLPGDPDSTDDLARGPSKVPCLLDRLDRDRREGPFPRDARARGNTIDDSVRVLQDLLIDTPVKVKTRQPRRSSRIAAKVASRVIR